MSGFSKEIGDALINHLLRNIQHNSPTTVYLALHDAGGGVPAEPGDQQATAFTTELGYTSYARKAITFDAPTGTDNSVSVNSAAIVFDAIDAGEGPLDVTGFSIWTAQKGVDSASSGTMIHQAAISAVKAFADADAPTVGAGEISATFD